MDQARTNKEERGSYLPGKAGRRIRYLGKEGTRWYPSSMPVASYLLQLGWAGLGLAELAWGWGRHT